MDAQVTQILYGTLNPDPNIRIKAELNLADLANTQPGQQRPPAIPTPTDANPFHLASYSDHAVSLAKLAASNQAGVDEAIRQMSYTYTF